MSAKKSSAGASLRNAVMQPFVASALRTLETEREGLAGVGASLTELIAKVGLPRRSNEEREEAGS